MSSYSDETHTYSTPGGTSGGPGSYGTGNYGSGYTGAPSGSPSGGGPSGGGPSGGGQGTTTWELGEFEAHAERLSRVHEAVLTTTQKTIDAVSSTSDAYGMLFGWAIMPFLNTLADGTIDFAENLADAVESSRQALRMTMAAYSDRESDNAASSGLVSAETLREMR